MSASPITRDNCWSVRQCTERLAALDQRSDGIVAGLDAFAQEIFDRMEGRITEHQAAVDHIAALLELAEHLVANLKGGFALPPTPEVTSAPRTPTPPVTYLQPIAQPPGYKAPAASPAQPHVHLLDRAAAAAHCRLSIQGFDAQRRGGRVPAPAKTEGRTPLWHPDQLAHVRNSKPNSGRRA
jgi:hypothetical protein